jgi:ribonuclease HII
VETRIVIGVDEVGRGCLAGPVVAAAVILPSKVQPWMEEIRDSKKVSPKKRVVLANKITENCLWSLRESSAYKIDEINILQATLVAMRAAVQDVYRQVPGLQKPGVVLVDGNHTIPDLNLPVVQEAIIGGDDIHRAIGAASILAKVYRDNYMMGIDSIHPEYGFAQHKGYGTEQHREAIMSYGPCPIHRKTFRGVYEYVKSESSI